MTTTSNYLRKCEGCGESYVGHGPCLSCTWRRKRRKEQIAFYVRFVQMVFVGLPATLGGLFMIADSLASLGGTRVNVPGLMLGAALLLMGLGLTWRALKAP